MSRAGSPSVGRSHSLARVAWCWGIPRATVYPAPEGGGAHDEAPPRPP